MNRTIILGATVFFALLGMSLVDGGTQASAGHGCRGCGGGLFSRLHARIHRCKGCDSGHKGHRSCYSNGGHRCKGGLFARLRARKHARRCCGVPQDCCGKHVEKTCCGTEHKGGKDGGKYDDGGEGGEAEAAGDELPDPPQASLNDSRGTRYVYRSVAFRR